jgi:hypothetical protein
MDTCSQNQNQNQRAAIVPQANSAIFHTQSKKLAESVPRLSIDFSPSFGDWKGGVGP